MTSNREEPVRLAVVGATDLERRLLDAAGREQPSAELTRKMRVALGLPVVGAALTGAVVASTQVGTSAPVAAAPVAAKVAAFKAATVWIAAGVLTAGALGGLAGVWLSRTPTPTPTAVTRAAAMAEPEADGEDTSPSTVTRRRERHAHATSRHQATAPTSAGDLRGEIALVDAARTAVRTGAPDEALSLLRRYRATYPAGTFRPEATALEVEALAATGQTDRAATLARQFLAQHPDSPVAARVARFANNAGR